jgi:hypothetical protein
MTKQSPRITAAEAQEQVKKFKTRRNQQWYMDKIYREIRGSIQRGEEHLFTKVPAKLVDGTDVNSILNILVHNDKYKVNIHYVWTHNDPILVTIYIHWRNEKV